MGEENAYVYRTSLYLIASASAEFFADIALCPMEAVKVSIFKVDLVENLIPMLSEGIREFLSVQLI